jgi:predicted dehydrogenase
MGDDAKNRPVRIGIVGCGNVMDGAYMPAIRKLNLFQQEVEVTAACHTSRDRCEKILTKWGIGIFTDDYRELCHSKDVDLVLVLTSMQAHGTIVSEALEAGKHVLVEKPMATTLAEAEKVLQVARQTPGNLACAPFVVLSPTYQAIWRKVQSGDIGKVCLARARYGWSGPDWSPSFYRQGGGCITDLSVYAITSLTGILGPARRVTAMTGVAIPERRVNGKMVRVEAEDNAQILMDFGESRFAVVTSGFTMQKYRSPAFEIYGSEGTVQMLGDDWAPEGYELWRNDVGAWQYFYETDLHWSWTDGLRHLVECIRHGTRPIPTPEHSFHVLEIMLAAQASGRDGRTRDIQSDFEPLKLIPASAQNVAGHRVHDPRREAVAGGVEDSNN